MIMWIIWLKSLNLRTKQQQTIQKNLFDCNKNLFPQRWQQT